MPNKETYVIYYNAKCGKCRTAKSALETAKLACEITEYLKEVPDKNTLKRVFNLLGKKPLDSRR
jgi:arsenate reductase-like glutaredoxin family protein